MKLDKLLRNRSPELPCKQQRDSYFPSKNVFIHVLGSSREYTMFFTGLTAFCLFNSLYPPNWRVEEGWVTVVSLHPFLSIVSLVRRVILCLFFSQQNLLTEVACNLQKHCSLQAGRLRGKQWPTFLLSQGRLSTGRFGWGFEDGSNHFLVPQDSPSCPATKHSDVCNPHWLATGAGQNPHQQHGLGKL